jgi:ABC-type molybdenum transport system ATPase subunit/photorepair protein PhrA
VPDSRSTSTGTLPHAGRCHVEVHEEVDTVAAVEVKNLGKTYGHVVAVDDLSFTIDHGEEFALLGPNGASKSTARALAHIRLPLVVLLHALWHTQRPAEAPRGGDERERADGHRT